MPAFAGCRGVGNAGSSTSSIGVWTRTSSSAWNPSTGTGTGTGPSRSPWSHDHAILLRHLNLGTFAQFVGTIRDDHFTSLQPGGDFRILTLHLPQRNQPKRHAAIRLNYISEGALGTALDAGTGRNHHATAHVEQHAGVDELVRKQREIGIGELRLELDGAGGGIDLVVHREQGAAGQLGLLRPVVGIDRRPVAGLKLFHDRGNAVFRQRKQHRDRLQLGNHHQPVDIPGSHDVADIDLAQADAPGNRRRHPCIAELQPGVIHHPAIRLDHALVLAHQRGLGIELLLGDRILREQGAVTRQIRLGVAELRLVARHLTLGLRQLHLERARIDFCQQFTRLHHLALAKQQAQQLAIHAAAYGHGIGRYGSAQAVDVDVHVASAGSGCHHRCQRPVTAPATTTTRAATLSGTWLAALGGSGASTRLGGTGRLAKPEIVNRRRGQQKQQHQPRPLAAAWGRGWGQQCGQGRLCDFGGGIWVHLGGSGKVDAGWRQQGFGVARGWRADENYCAEL